MQSVMMYKLSLIHYEAMIVILMGFLFSVVGSCRHDCVAIIEYCDTVAHHCSFCAERPCEVEQNGELKSEDLCKRHCLAYYKQHFNTTVDRTTAAATVTSQAVQSTSSNAAILMIVMICVALLFTFAIVVLLAMVLCNRMSGEIKEVLGSTGRGSRITNTQAEYEMAHQVTMEERQNNYNDTRHKVCPSGAILDDTNGTGFPEQSAQLINETRV